VKHPRLQFEGDEYTSSEEEMEAEDDEDDDEYIDDDEEELNGPYEVDDEELGSAKRVDRELEWDDTSLDVKLKQGHLNETRSCNKSTSNFIDSNQFV
jgi:hypothetical protein